ncbi:MAG TPA: hypothetical protein VNM14_21095 [Planctomycetota bacterium]|nr:hypothetical protein [Planctomycetota bacterium]
MNVLPASCEKAILSRFLRAEAMAMWAVKSAQSDVPKHALSFLQRHEEEEREHLKIFEGLTGEQAREKAVLPKLPKQWHAMAVHLYGYEALGLEFARLLAGIRPDLAHVLKDEEVHVGFFENEVKRILDGGRGPANGAREYARAWMRRIPRTLERYLRGDGLEPYQAELSARILESIRSRFAAIGLLSGA